MTVTLLYSPFEKGNKEAAEAAAKLLFEAGAQVQCLKGMLDLPFLKQIAGKEIYRADAALVLGGDGFIMHNAKNCATGTRPSEESTGGIWAILQTERNSRRKRQRDWLPALFIPRSG